MCYIGIFGYATYIYIEDEERVLVKWVGGDRTPSCMDEVGSCANPTHRPHPSSPDAVWFPLYLHFFQSRGVFKHHIEDSEQLNGNARSHCQVLDEFICFFTTLTPCHYHLPLQGFYCSSVQHYPSLMLTWWLEYKSMLLYLAKS